MEFQKRSTAFYCRDKFHTVARIYSRFIVFLFWQIMANENYITVETLLRPEEKSCDNTTKPYFLYQPESF